MRRPFLFVVMLAVSLFALMSGFSAFVAPYPASGCCGMMGPNTMVGPGIWGGFGRGMMGPGWNTTWRDLNLSTDDVKTYFQRWLAWQGNPRLKVGDVKEKDVDTIVADIVTKDNSLVQRFVINRRNGFFRPSED
ncbi:MAG: hypothetical protein ACYC5H_14820 [Methylovirgula sp.]